MLKFYTQVWTEIARLVIWKKGTWWHFLASELAHMQIECEAYCDQLHIIDWLTQAVPERTKHTESPTIKEKYCNNCAT